MSQTDRLYHLLQDMKPHRTDEIVEAIYGPGLSLSRVGARVYDIQKRYNVEIKSYPDKNNKRLWFYQLVKDQTDQTPKPKFTMIGKTMPTLTIKPKSETQLELFG